MKICLLNCSAPFLIDERVFPPLGLLAVGTTLKLQGHEVSIKNESDDSDYFAVGPTTSEYYDACQKLKSIKSKNPESKVVIGGPHAETNAEDCLKDGFDTVALGDGENITAETFQTAGIVDLKRKLLSEYPRMDRSLLDIKSYRYLIDGKLATTIMTSRGCPYHCGFCAKMGSRLRYYSAERIEEEVIYLKETFGYEALMVFDDTFIVDKRRAFMICDVLKRHGITWRCFVRGDLVVKHGQELVTTMLDSGCVEVGIGVESGSDKILRSINKGENATTIQQAIYLLRQIGIRVKGFFIIGLPGENLRSLRLTRLFLERTPLDDADFAIYHPYKGSPIWDNKEDYDIKWEDIPVNERFYKGISRQYRSSVSTSSMTSHDIIAAREKIEKWFKHRLSRCDG